MVFLGLVAMSDPPRQGVREAIEKCHRASIRIIMVTGDYGLTALSIAKKIGIVQGDDARVVSGLELAGMDDNQLKEALKRRNRFLLVWHLNKNTVWSMPFKSLVKLSLLLVMVLMMPLPLKKLISV